MAIGWIAAVPWSEVISATPKVIEGAVKLWNAVSKKSPTTAQPNTTDVKLTPEAQAISVLESRIVGLEDQMQKSSELIKALADQNGQLVARIETHRKRIFLLVVAIAAMAVITMTCTIFVLTRSA